MSLVECAVALVLAGMLSVELARSLHASASIVVSASMHAAAIDAARNLLEREIGSPCGPPPACPQGFSCSVSRDHGVGAGLDRLRASAAARLANGKVELSVLVRPPDCS